MELEEIESSYLVYCMDNYDLNDLLDCEIQIVLADRFKFLRTANKDSVVRGDLKDVWRKLVKKYHPDKEGGSHHAVIAINEFYNLLK